MAALRIIRTEDGSVKALSESTNVAADLLAEFLRVDVQVGTHSFELYLSHIERVFNGEEPEWVGTGDAFTVEVNKTVTVVNHEYNSGSFRIATRQMIQVLLAWRCVAIDRGCDGVVVNIDIESA